MEDALHPAVPVFSAIAGSALLLELLQGPKKMTKNLSHAEDAVKDHLKSLGLHLLVGFVGEVEIHDICRGVKNMDVNGVIGIPRTLTAANPHKKKHVCRLPPCDPGILRAILCFLEGLFIIVMVCLLANLWNSHMNDT